MVKKRIGTFEERIRAFTNDELTKGEKFFIADENDNIISGGYKNKALAEKFFKDFRLSRYEKLQVIKLDITER